MPDALWSVLTNERQLIKFHKVINSPGGALQHDGKLRHASFKRLREDQDDAPVFAIANTGASKDL